jgi:hypothetical protein
MAAAGFASSPVMPSTPFADCPTSLDVLFVPGGLDGSLMMMEDQEVIEFLADPREDGTLCRQRLHRRARARRGGTAARLQGDRLKLAM